MKSLSLAIFRRFQRLIFPAAAWTAILSFAVLGAFAPAVFAQGSAIAAVKPIAPPPAVTHPAERLTLAGVPNAGRVNEHLFRGAQPLTEGFPELKKAGVNIVVDLNNTGRDRERERREVESQGMRYVSIPLSPLHQPSQAAVAEFLILVRENPEQKVFVHCKHGADRTGVLIAAFRMSSDGWTPEQAKTEMLLFHFHQRWLHFMTSYVYEFPKDFASDPAFAPLRPAARTAAP